MKKLILIMLLTLVITGCYGKAEADERKYVITAGIDVGENKKYSMTIGEAQLKSDIGDETKPEKCSVEYGDSIIDIKNKADNGSDRKMYFGQMKTLVIGRKIIEDSELFKIFLYDAERMKELNTKVIVVAADNADNAVNAIMQKNDGNGMYIWDFYSNGDLADSDAAYMDIEKIIYNIRNSKGYIIPKLYCDDGEIYISDGYVMNGSEYKGDISENDIKGIKWLNGDADKSIIESNGIYAEILRQNTHIYLNDNRYNIEISAECSIDGAGINNISADEISNLKEVIKNIIRNTINKAAETKTDFINAGYDLNEYPSDISVDLKIISTGVIK